MYIAMVAISKIWKDTQSSRSLYCYWKIFNYTKQKVFILFSFSNDFLPKKYYNIRTKTIQCKFITEYVLFFFERERTLLCMIWHFLFFYWAYVYAYFQDLIYAMTLWIFFQDSYGSEAHQLDSIQKFDERQKL